MGVGEIVFEEIQLEEIKSISGRLISETVVHLRGDWIDGG